MVAEKILSDGERLPRFAGVAGTTGYEWLNIISRLLLDDRGLAALARTWRDVSGEEPGFDAILIDAKRRVIANILNSEFTVLRRLLARIAAGHYSTRDYTAERLRAAFALFILHFPIYRTYITASGPSREDRAIIEDALAKARADWFGSDVDIFDFLRDALTLDLVAPGRVGHSIARDRRFAFKVQQFTGPMMAKSLEDTAFYRFHRLLALNEVGGNPAAGALSVANFHGRIAADLVEGEEPMKRYQAVSSSDFAIIGPVNCCTLNAKRRWRAAVAHATGATRSRVSASRRKSKMSTSEPNQSARALASEASIIARSSRLAQ